MRSMNAILCAALAVVVLLTGPAGAASIQITSVAAVDDPNYDLTATYGRADWAYWTSTANPAAGTPSNAKAGGVLLGDMSPVGGGNLRGSTSTNKPIYDFVYTDGTSPAAGSVSDSIGLFNSQLGPEGVGDGVQVDVIAPTADPFTIYLWATGYRATGQLTATMGSVLDTDSYTFGDRRPGRFFAIDVDPDAGGELVNLQWIMTAQSDGFANVSVTGVAANPGVPEPASVVLLMLAVPAVAARLRRRMRARS